MRIHVAQRDGLVQATGMAKDVYELLGLLLGKANRVTVVVYGSGMCVNWEIGR